MYKLTDPKGADAAAAAAAYADAADAYADAAAAFASLEALLARDVPYDWADDPPTSEPAGPAALDERDPVDEAHARGFREGYRLAEERARPAVPVERLAGALHKTYPALRMDECQHDGPMTDDTLRAALERIAEMTSREPHRSLPIYAIAKDALAASVPDEGPRPTTVEEVAAALERADASLRPALPAALDAHSVAAALERTSEAYAEAVRSNGLETWHTANRFSWFKYAEHIIAEYAALSESSDD